MGTALGLTAAVMFGASHFFNGVLARRAPALTVALCSQAGGAALFLVWVLVTGVTTVASDNLMWSFIAGAGAGVGVGALYEGMRLTRVSVVVPVTGIVSVAVPFLLSVTVLGERPDPVVIAAAALMLPATWLLCRPTRSAHDVDGSNSRALLYGLIAGLGYSTQLFALSRIATDEPAVPMLISQLISIAVLLLILQVRGRRREQPGDRNALGWASLVGMLAALAMIAFLYATRQAALAPVMVAIALYPALPVLLAVVVLRERLGRPQILGLGIAALVLPLLNVAGA